MQDSVVRKLVEYLEDGVVSTCTSVVCLLKLADDEELNAMDRDDLYERWSLAKDFYVMERN